VSISPGGMGLLWLWATVADLGSGAEPERPADAAAEDNHGAQR